MDLVLESIKSTRGVRLSEEDIKSKMGRWFKSAPKKIGKDDVESSESSDYDAILFYLLLSYIQ
uniref:Uncharacterized protein n=1 Tax=Daphnia galeata TaxID=27404 RepID=A0A8J2RQR4_9CRUS|nr:unnamed protein product [Daphnia galeata]